MSIEASSSSTGRSETLVAKGVLPDISGAAIFAPGNCTITALMLSLEPARHIETQRVVRLGDRSIIDSNIARGSTFLK